MSEVRRRPDWLGIGLFYLIACSISVPLLAWRDLAPASWAASPIPPLVRPLLYGWGPAIAGLIVLRLRAAHHVRTITLTGGAPWASVIAVVYPIVLLGIYAPARDVASPHLMGLFAGAHAVLYAFGEEVGWRGYLQDALRPLRPAIRYTTIGVMWGMWHFLTFAGHGSVGSMVVRLLVFYAILIAASAAIGAAVDRSRSLLVATACHLFYTFSQMHSGRDRWVLLGFLVPVVVILVRKWPVPERRDVSIA